MQAGGSEGRSVISREIIDIIASETAIPHGKDVLEVLNGDSGAVDSWLADL